MSANLAQDGAHTRQRARAWAVAPWVPQAIITTIDVSNGAMANA